MKIYKTNGNYNYDYGDGSWVGGRLKIPNASNGYHAILKQWWDNNKVHNANWLLISEKNTVKPHFESLYKADKFYTLEYFSENNEVDFNYDLCDRNLVSYLPKFDVVLCQATLEHIYDPVTAIHNMINVLNKEGIALIHTHIPGFDYHPYPRDYLRYYPDWFLDVPKFINNSELLELCTDNEIGHVFALYKRV